MYSFFFDHTESIKQSDYGLTLLSFCHAGIDFATRKIASLLKPQKVIKQDGDSFTIRTLSTFRNYEVSFKIGEEFTEETKGLDNRSCQARGKKHNNNKICVLQKLMFCSNVQTYFKAAFLPC